MNWLWIIIISLMLYSVHSEASIICTVDSRGVQFCRDTNTGQSWTINPSPVGTTIRR
jgi:hypothetical protein